MADDSSDSFKSLAVVIVLGVMLVLMCAIVPVGVGAMMYFRMRESAQQAMAAQERALVAEQAARAQAELARAEAARALAERLANPTIAPPIPVEAAPSELTLEQRKAIYLGIKSINDQLALLEEAGKDDPTVQELLAATKSQREAFLEQMSRSSGITRQKLDEIVAEGEREKW